MPDFATSDLHLAIAHHILVFSLAGVLAFEVGAVRPGMTGSEIVRVGRVDLWYGILAVAIIGVGFWRAVFAAKGWAYYSANAFFWAKIATFALVGLLSVAPTTSIIRWRRALRGDANFVPAAREVRTVRRFLFLEVVLFLLIPCFAAAMARGYGSFTP
jgi:putative membrane protein